MSKQTTPKRVTVQTPVGTRTILEGSPWWKGDGRGHTREFITNETTMTCRTCEEDLAEDAFPTFTIPRKDGRKRSDECRECRDARREANAKKAKRQEAARKAAATRKATAPKAAAKAA